MHFECDFSAFMIQTITLSHQCYYELLKLEPLPSCRYRLSTLQIDYSFVISSGVILAVMAYLFPT